MPYKNKRSEYQSNYVKQRCADDPEFAERQRSIKRASYHKNKLNNGKTKYELLAEQGLCPKCGKCKTDGGRCTDCLNVANATNRKVLDAIHDHYGRICKCCGETEKAFLTLDHINGDGSEQRRDASGINRGGGTNWRFYMVRKAQKTGEWPEDLQILCYNCNCGRQRNGGICPHHLRHTSKVS